MKIEDRIKSVPFWFHSIDLGGHTTPGHQPPGVLKRIADEIPQDLTGKSVLDIGAWDGYFSFLAEQRGASRVLAIDTFDMGDPRLPQSIDGFNTAKEILGSKVEYRIMRVEDLDQLDEMFDVVFFFGVYYHVENPILSFDRACEKSKSLLLVEGDMLEHPLRMMIYDFSESDRSRAWRLTRPLVIQLLLQRGFVSAEERFKHYTAEIPFPTQTGWPITFAAARVFLRCWR